VLSDIGLGASEHVVWSDDREGRLFWEGASFLGVPSNLPRGFQRFGFVKPFHPGGFTDLG